MERSLAERRFTSPQEEIDFLREEVRRKEAALLGIGKEVPRERVIREEIEKYGRNEPAQVLSEDYAIAPTDRDAIVLDLAPRRTDKKMEELLGILTEKGIRNALAVVEKLHDAELEDDFHRLLVQYVRKQFPVPDSPRASTLLRGIEMVLYEVTLPLGKEGETGQSRRTLRELLSGMEQLYAGLLSVADEKDVRPVALEIAVPEETREIIFYAAVPTLHRDLFEKQFSAIFPEGKLHEQLNDYNIFHERSSIAASVAEFERHPAFPLKTYDEFDHDPLDIIVNAFSKLKQRGEGAALQVVLMPARGSAYVEKYRRALDDIKKGVKLSHALNVPEGMVADFTKSLKEVFAETKHKSTRAPGEKEAFAEEAIKKKIESPILKVAIRAVAVAESAARADEVLQSIETAFNQFESTKGNGLRFTRVPRGKEHHFTHEFSFRLWNQEESLPMSLRELVSLFHFPVSTEDRGAADLKRATAAVAPAPLSMEEGILLGVNRFQARETPVTLGASDRLRHFYTIGQTGTGKTNFLKNMIIQDIQRGEGVCFIDPHGSDIEDILANIPKERIDDLIYFDPAYIKRSVGLNMLEYDPRFPEQKTFVVNELLSIFNKLFDMKVAGGPAFEQYFRNSALLVMEHPESGSTLLEIARVLGDKSFRDLKLSHTQNPIIKEFWRNAEKTTGEQALANFVPYITNKFDGFLNNEYMRTIVTQERSAFNFRDMMDHPKIFLVNLSKGRLGELNANLLGLLLVGKILMAALSRVDSLGKDLPPFYLYIDEFQNVTTDSIATILSEARKYKLSLTIAHQFIAQLEENIRDAVFGNVGSIASFRVGADDAEYLEKRFAPSFSARDLMTLENFSCYANMLVGGRPSTPFSLEIPRAPEGNPGIVPELKELSYLSYGVPREEVEERIRARYQAGQ